MDDSGTIRTTPVDGKLCHVQSVLFIWLALGSGILVDRSPRGCVLPWASQVLSLWLPCVQTTAFHAICPYTTHAADCFKWSRFFASCCRTLWVHVWPNVRVGFFYVWPLYFCFLFWILNIWFVGYHKTNLTQIVLSLIHQSTCLYLYKHTVLLWLSVWHYPDTVLWTIAESQWCLGCDVNADDSRGGRVDSLPAPWSSDRFHRTLVSYTYISVFIKSLTLAARHSMNLTRHVCPNHYVDVADTSVTCTKFLLYYSTNLVWFFISIFANMCNSKISPSESMQ